jgi:hypothetical protein
VVAKHLTDKELVLAEGGKWLRISERCDAMLTGNNNVFVVTHEILEYGERGCLYIDIPPVDPRVIWA